MPKKKRDRRGGLVYSTDPDFDFGRGEGDEEETPLPSGQRLVVRIDRRRRRGKEVTLVEGFAGTSADLADLGRALRTHCGAGGSVAEGVILVQGDHRDKIVAWLEQAGYQVRCGN